MSTKKRDTESGETGARSERQRIYQWLVDQKWSSIEKEHLRALAEDQRKVAARLFRSLSSG